MLNEEIIEILSERLATRIENANIAILKQIGESIKLFADLTPTDARQLAQILKYGGSYNKIVAELQRVTNLNVQDIYDIFEEVAKRDHNFAKKFYDYRGVDFIPFDKNESLRRQVKALADIAVDDYLVRTSAIGFNVKDLNDNIIFQDISDTYRNVIDEAVLSVGQGKETFDRQMRKIIKELGTSGIKSIDYASGRTMRLDSAVQMNMKASLTNLHDTMQKQFGEEFGADGVEISVHINPAIDHEKVQGHQFSNEEYEKLQNGEQAEDYNGVKLSLDHDDNGAYRPIGEYNCYHYIFSIVLGLNDPEYSQEQLEKINENNRKGFDFEGKHYTNYEGTQLQRRLELEIRKEKEKQVLYRASGESGLEMAKNSQKRINMLVDKYNDLIKVSGLPAKMKRMQISGYRKIKID